MSDTPTITPISAAAPSLADWHASLAAIRELGSAPQGREQVPLAAAVGRVLAEGAGSLAAGALVQWRHLPLLVAAGCKTLVVRPRVRAGIVALSGSEQAEASAPLIVAAFEQMGGRALPAAAAEPAHRLCLALEMCAKRCELIFVVADPALQCWPMVAGGPGGGPPCTRLGTTTVMFLAPRLGSALAAFVTHAVPLVRRLQGRGDALPAVRVLPGGDASAEMTLVRERIEGERVLLSPCGMTPSCLAAASAITWRPPDLAGGRVLLPFDEWLR
ncbi:hypothetical protein SNE35_04625 [Paucibacter sp. R3-3]|uniref:Uncharacterized protein n=1 Tax=Roseateles agri TaxID=3098619 RepID=A0ABU5DET1_9BURK|nr:hypothetical protein [Paucibacter sp. R3-3]MDY0743774.1 hypothetical protein [Paucibacter sp. R3-3]